MEETAEMHTILYNIRNLFQAHGIIQGVILDFATEFSCKLYLKLMMDENTILFEGIL